MAPIRKDRAVAHAGPLFASIYVAALARCVGIVDDVDFVKLVSDHSFTSATGLSGEEEDEVARRVVELFEENSSQDEEDEEMEAEEQDDTINDAEENESD
jgi:hypothetical protein